MGVSYLGGFYNPSKSAIWIPKGRAKSKKVKIQRNKNPSEVRETS